MDVKMQELQEKDAVIEKNSEKHQKEMEALKREQEEERTRLKQEIEELSKDKNRL